MATKREVLEQASRGEGCLGKAKDDEVVFVLRAQDRLMPLLIDQWAALAELHGCPIEKVNEARECAHRARMQQRERGSKYPD